MINQLRNREDAQPDCPDYLFDILSGDQKRLDERGYREYQSALRQFNNCLKDLARALHLQSPSLPIHFAILGQRQRSIGEYLLK